MERPLGWRAEQTSREPMRSLGRPSVNSEMLSARFGSVLLRDYRVRTQPCRIVTDSCILIRMTETPMITNQLWQN